MKDYKVRCVGYKANEKCFTVGKVYEVKNNTIVSDDGSPFNSWGSSALGRKPDFEHLQMWFRPWYTFELVNEEKIIITTDGKTTTATLYRDNEKVTAEAKCSPEDKFDFITGAKLAMHRLVEKATEVSRGGFKVGDRVKWNGHKGTVICIDDGKLLGVELDNHPGAGHNCDGAKLIAGKTGTTRRCKWCLPSMIVHIDPNEPEYYNGKVVCVEKKYKNHIPLPDFTVGKVYEVVDGVITDDTDWESNHYTDLEKLCQGMGNTFIPLVE